MIVKQLGKISRYAQINSFVWTSDWSEKIDLDIYIFLSHIYF